MEASVIAGLVAVLLWVLSRVPGFTATARLAAALERDLRIFEKLPSGRAHNELSTLVEAQALELVRLRREALATPERTPPSRERPLPELLSSRVLARAGVLASLAAAGLFLTSPEDSSRLDGQGIATLVVASVVVLASGVLAVVTVVREAREIRVLRARHDERHRRRGLSTPPER